MTKTMRSVRDGNGFISLLDPGVLLLNLALLLTFSNVAFFYLYPVVLSDMGAGSHTIGWVMGAFSLAGVLSRPVMGSVAARCGEFRVMSGGAAVMVLAAVCYPLVGTVGVFLFCVRALHGLGFSAFVAGSFSAVARLFPGGRRAQAYGMVGASIMAAVALAPLAGEVLIRRFGFLALFAGAGLAAMLSWIGVQGARGLESGEPREKPEAHRRYRRLLENGSFRWVLISTIIFAHCQSTVFNFLALEAERKGASAGTFFFVAFSVAIGVLLTTGRMIDRVGTRRFLRIFYPPLAAGLILLPVLFGSAGEWGPALLFGAGMGFLFPAHNALAAGHGEPGDQATVMALFTAVYDSGFITGAVASGWLAGRIGLDGLFFATGGMALLGFLVCLLAPIREEPREPGSTRERLPHG